MKTILIKVGILIAGIALVGCTTTSNEQMPQQEKVKHHKSQAMQTASSENPGESQDVGIARVGMDAADRSKLSHALDKAPGRATHWTNPNTNVAYTVTPIRAVTINGNHNCRKYSVTTVSSGAERTSMGTACVGDDSAWKAV